jgi:C-terminal processing protease CtpA/Prc
MNGVKEKGWEKFGFKEGDSIIKINGKEICNSTNITPMFIEAINNKGTITIGRKGEGNPIKIHFPSFKK